MQFRSLIFYLFPMLVFCHCSKAIIPDKPNLSRSLKRLDTLPLSNLDIPVKINLKPIYQLVEKNVDRVYTSPGWPYDYVVENCDTRYMYHFRRGPMEIVFNGDQLQLGFTGFYQVAGSQRICSGTGSNRTAITPWSPPCSCGIKEPERRVQVSFGINLALGTDFHLQGTINKKDPIPIDKCNMCLWEQDLTPTVMERLNEQLDEATASMKTRILSYDFRPQFQSVWNQLCSPVAIPELGYLTIQPQQLRFSHFSVQGDTAFLSVGLSARPQILTSKPANIKTVIPDIMDAGRREGFHIYLEAHLDYDSLSRRLNEQIRGKKIELEKGGKFVVLDKCEVYGADNENIILKVQFSGSHKGIFYLTGKPVYHADKRSLLVENLDFDIQTKDLLLQSAQWLFSGRILSTLQSYTKFDASQYETLVMEQINRELNREIWDGMILKGKVDQVGIVGIYPFTEKLVVRLQTSGNLNLEVGKLAF